jgi:hypothetical protein
MREAGGGIIARRARPARDRSGATQRDGGEGRTVAYFSAGTVTKPSFWMPARRAADMISASFW